MPAERIEIEILDEKFFTGRTPVGTSYYFNAAGNDVLHIAGANVSQFFDDPARQGGICFPSLGGLVFLVTDVVRGDGNTWGVKVFPPLPRSIPFGEVAYYANLYQNKTGFTVAVTGYYMDIREGAIAHLDIGGGAFYPCSVPGMADETGPASEWETIATTSPSSIDFMDNLIQYSSDIPGGGGAVLRRGMRIKIAGYGNGEILEVMQYQDQNTALVTKGIMPQKVAEVLEYVPLIEADDDAWTVFKDQTKLGGGDLHAHTVNGDTSSVYPDYPHFHNVSLGTSMSGGEAHRHPIKGVSVFKIKNLKEGAVAADSVVIIGGMKYKVAGVDDDWMAVHGILSQALGEDTAIYCCDIPGGLPIQAALWRHRGTVHCSQYINHGPGLMDVWVRCYKTETPGYPQDGLNLYIAKALAPAAVAAPLYGSTIKHIHQITLGTYPVYVGGKGTLRVRNLKNIFGTQTVDPNFKAEFEVPGVPGTHFS